MTLRARLTAAFFVVVLGPVVLSGYLLLGLFVQISPNQPAGAVEPNPDAVRAAVAARCQQLNADATALAVSASAAGRSYAVTPAAATGPWATCGGPDLVLAPVVTLAAGTRYTGLAARAPINTSTPPRDPTGSAAPPAAIPSGTTVIGYAYAVQPLDDAFLAELSRAAGGRLALVGVGDPTARTGLPLPLAAPDAGAVSPAPPGRGGVGARLAVIVTAIGLSAAFGWWLAGLATQPLDVLLRAVERVVAGDLTVRSNLAGRDATGRLGSGLDRLIAGMQETQHLSVTDPLTGLGNVRQLSESLRHEVERASRFGRSLGILVLDLDHFKNVNDRYGHRAGDAVLVEFARRVRGVVREVDRVFRQGGEEFVILLPETDVAGSLTAARRIGDAMRDVPFQVAAVRAGDSAEVSLTVTVSIGVAVFPRHALTGAEVLDAADAALYTAKAAGRDTFALAGPVLPQARGPASPFAVTAVLLAEAGGASTGTTSPRAAPGG